ncbi:MAG: magnesium transporter [Deltaproteobacteria bacterium]|nr:MAG: magnesium transporter [Deltaproteobacteria bacterium]
MEQADLLVRYFVEGHPREAAQAFEQLEADEAARIIKKLPLRAVVLLVERLASHSAAAVLERLDPKRVRELLEIMSPRAASLVLQHLESSKREEALTHLPGKIARQLRDLMTYPPNTAGGMMEPRVTSIPADLTVKAATSYLRKAPRQTLYYLYVADSEGKLAGVLNMRELMLASPQDRIESLTRREILSVPETMTREEVVTLMRRHRFLALPVVDSEGRLVGIIKHDEALRAGQLEAFENLQKMVGAGGDERALSPVSTVVKRRLPWLYVNLLTAFLAAAVVGMFEGTIQKVTALAVLLPIVSGQGGNTGAQALAVVMRGLALREIISGAAKRVIVKEVLAGLYNGIAIAIGTAGAVWIWSRNNGLVLVIFLSMIVNMVAAGLSGAAIPLILRAFNRDPAQSSSIFLTTVTDCVGFASFLGFAVLFMPLLIGS